MRDERCGDRKMEINTFLLIKISHPELVPSEKLPFNLQPN